MTTVKELQKKYGKKSKIIAILLSFPFSFFAYLYTYKANYVKFWTILGLNAFIMTLAITNPNSHTYGYPGDLIYKGTSGIVAMLYLFNLAFVLIDTLSTPNEFFEEYGLKYGPDVSNQNLYNKKIWRKKNKTLAMVISILGPFGWFYTGAKNAWKIMPHLIALSYGLVIILETKINELPPLQALLVLIVLTLIWCWPVLDHFKTPDEVFDNYGLIYA